MVKSQTQRTGLIILSLFLAFAVALVVLIAIQSGVLGWLIVGFVIVSVAIITAAAVIVNRVAVPFMDARLKYVDARLEHERRMFELKMRDDRRQIAPPAQTNAPEIDPRHALLVNLCLLTIKSNDYGPTSKRLMSANDAQADRSGQFADRMNWDRASKYGQDIGKLYTKVGGPPQEQGLRIKGDGGIDGTASDLLVALNNRNLILDAAINALPGRMR